MGKPQKRKTEEKPKTVRAKRSTLLQRPSGMRKIVFRSLAKFLKD